VIVFSDKKSTGSLVKVLSKVLKDKVAIGEVKNTDRKLVERFNVNSYPTILGLTSEMGGRVYDGEIARDPMERWIRNFAANAPAHLGAQEFTSTTQAEGNCDKSDSNFCFLLFIDPNDSKDLITSLQTQFPQDPIRFYWVNKSKHIDFHSKF